MKNIMEVTEELVAANLRLRGVKKVKDLYEAQVDINAAVTVLCELVGLDKCSLERFRRDGRKRA